MNDSVEPLDDVGAVAGFPIVGVGASAGGLEAFTQLLQALPPDTGMAFVLVQHLAPAHASALAEILSRATAMPVREVDGESPVEPDHVYVIPPGRSMVIERGALRLLPRKEVGVHHPVDEFLRSLADDRRHLAIGVVLSGTATDGTRGLEAIKAEGGITIAQDATARQGGMPSHAIASGCVDLVLPPDGIAAELVRISRHPHARTGIATADADGHTDLAQVIGLLKQATGVDFTHYKPNTLYRRVTRRMILRQVDGLSGYLEYLRRTPTELEALRQDILISVTSFFRNPEAFAVLKSTVFPRLLKDRARHAPVRIWTLGCSTGQEAYSLAIAFAEAAEAVGSTAPLQLFATDINAVSIEQARAGLYPPTIAREMSPERLQRFFVAVEGGYRISKSIRDSCVFSRHDVLTDPPFSRIDMVSCRNVLIYLQPVLQQRVVPLLHYALQPAGYLWLGASETIGSYRDLFDIESSEHKIYRRRPGSEAGVGLLPVHRSRASTADLASVTARPHDGADLPQKADRILLNRFVPPSVVVSADLEIVQFRGQTGPYLAPAPGKASLNLLKMLREGLLVGVRSAILRAGRDGVPVREAGLRVKSDGGHREVEIEVIPLDGVGGEHNGGYLLLFRDVAHTPRPEPPREAAPTSDIRRLEQELAATRDYLNSVIEQQETANEELQSANEEVQSANEELQSTNEELETSAEEIQSSNEELATLNAELNDRSAELHRVNDDFVNLLGSIQLAVVILGPDLRVRRFSPHAQMLLGLSADDVGRPLTDLKLDLDDLPDLEPLLRRSLAGDVPGARDVRDRSGSWHSLRLRPYQGSDRMIGGVVMMLVDVDAAKRAHAHTASIVATVHEPLLVLDADLRIRSASRLFYETFGDSPDETIDQNLYELADRLWDIPELRAQLSDVLHQNSQFENLEIEREFPRLGVRTLLLNGRQLETAEPLTPSILLAIEDITIRRRSAAELQASELRFRRLFETAQDGLLILDATSQRITLANPRVIELLGVGAEHLVGKELWEVGLLPDPDACRSAMAQLIEQGSLHQGPLELTAGDGRRRAIELAAGVYEEDHHQVIQCTVHDITERSRLESLLLTHTAELSELDRRKDEFLAMLSHELRNPLAPIASAVRLLALQSDSENRLQLEARQIIERQAAVLERLVGDLLEMSRITAGKLQLRKEAVLVNDIVRDTLEVILPQIGSRSSDLTVSLPDEPMWLHADPARLGQVAANLLSNAIKFSEPGDRIWLTAEREGDQCALHVRDSGMGIEPGLLPGVFDLFTQGGRGLDRSQGGLGIGLALVRQITTLHGGTVEVRSVVGEGSEFVVRLPLGPAAAPSSPPPAGPGRPDGRRLRVLVVDDNADALAGIAMVLEASGHEAFTASDGTTGLRAALDHAPDVVLLDIGMPNMDGFEVAQRIRDERSLAHVVLVALSGYSQPADRSRALQAGFDHYMVKPPDFAKLDAILAGVATSST